MFYNVIVTWNLGDKQKRKGYRLYSDVFVCQVDVGVTVLFSFGQFDTARVTWEERTLIEEWPLSDCPMGLSVKHFSLLMTDFEGPSYGWYHPWKVVLRYLRKQAEQAIGSKPVNSVPPCSRFQFLPSGSCYSSWLLPSVTDCDREIKLNTPFPFFRSVFYHNRKQTELAMQRMEQGHGRVRS